MKSSVLVAVTGAILATASPLDLFKRKIITDVVLEYVTVTVTAGEQHTFYAGKHSHPTTSTSTSTSSTPPPPPPATSTPPPPPPPPATSTPEPTPEPAPSTTEVPVFIETPTAVAEVSPVAEVTVQAASVVEAAPEATAAATTQASAAAPTDFSSTVLYHHNVHRFNHSSPAMSYSDTHAGYAEQTADKCVFAHDLTPGGGGYGQNLAVWGSSGDAESLGASAAVAQAASNMWYAGELNQFPSSSYGLDNPDMSNFEGFGHFTQLVWKSSTQVGCSSKYCAAGTIYADMGSWLTVCNYYPAGNMGGEYGANVLPPLGEASVSA